MSFESAGKIITKAINQKGLAKEAASARVCFEAEKILSEFFPKIKNKLVVKSFTNSTLKVVSQSPIINQEIQFKKEAVIKRLNQKLDSQVVRDLRFGIGN